MRYFILILNESPTSWRDAGTVKFPFMNYTYWSISEEEGELNGTYYDRKRIETNVLGLSDQQDIQLSPNVGIRVP